MFPFLDQYLPFNFKTMDIKSSNSLTRIWQQLYEVKIIKDSFIREETGYIPISVLEDLQKLDGVLENLELQLNAPKY